MESVGTPIAFHFGSRFKFDFGLSHTSFDYSHTVWNKTDYSFDEPVTLSIDITNTGERDGAEIVQFYALDQVCSHVWSLITRNKVSTCHNSLIWQKMYYQEIGV